MTVELMEGTKERVSPRKLNRVVLVLTVVSVVVTILLTDAMFRMSGFWQGSQTAIYWLSQIHSAVPLLIAATLTGFLLPFAGLGHRRLGLRVGLSLFSAVLIFLVYATLLGPSLTRQKHLGSQRLNNHVYYLATQDNIFNFWYPSTVSAYLFECDAVGLLCHRIYVSEPIPDSSVTLSADPAAGQLQLLRSDGEVLAAVTP